MGEIMNKSWIDFYTKFANELVKYKTDRETLISKLKKAYASIPLKFPKVESDNQVYDLDPFTIYGFFNKGITDQNRKRIIGAFIKEFGLDAKIPESFDSVPVLNNLAAAFFGFLPGRDSADIDHLWDLFQAAIEFADKSTGESRQNFIDAYNVVRKQERIRWNLTMGLYWIRPYDYLSLDSRNRWFFNYKDFIPQTVRDALPKLREVPGAETYLGIVKNFQNFTGSRDSRYGSLPELSYAAWIESERVNKENRETDTSEKETSNTLSDVVVPQKRYWVYAPGRDASMWEEFYSSGIMALGWDELGDYSHYDSKKAVGDKLIELHSGNGSMKNSAHAVWQFYHDMRDGDIIFVKKGRYEILGRGVVTSDYIYDPERDNYQHVRKVDWNQKGSWKLDSQISMKTLTDMTPYTEVVEKIESFFDQEEELDLVVPEANLAPYTRDDFLSGVFMEEEEYDRLVDILKRKKNVILPGPPGVGKTFAANRLAYSIMGHKDSERVAMIQFHQSYSYEDFIMGFRPSAAGFELKKGSFYNFCRMAEEDSDNDYFFIIDEINRGNLSKIFGELFMLLESDKRGIPMQLLYSDERFTIPPNVYIIGMMNTADRSLAIMDYALRRRFAFVDMKPGFDTEGFRTYQDNLQDASFNRLVSVVTELNKEIKGDEMLGEGFQIGHSYLCNLEEDSLESDLNSIVEYELIPLLKEYWFDDSQKIRTWSEKLRRSIK